MSSSKSHKSCSGSVHDSDSEFCIEYGQKQSPLSPNIPLTTPISSSINVSGLNIDVGNPKAPTSSTWSIPNISITPIPLIPLVHKHMCLRGQKAHLKSHQTLIPNKNFHERGWGQQKGPLENVTWSGPLEGKPGLTLHKNMAAKGKSVRSQEPIEDRESLDVIIHMRPNQEQLMPVHKEKKWCMMRMRTCLQLKWKQMMNQGGTISRCMSMALSQI
ncbi:hypothetical protein O181_127173, partial [Austropuccinia psidii MF-1]|nr:hypothetical protein [Austropuccinia psidii MF-1]